MSTTKNNMTSVFFQHKTLYTLESAMFNSRTNKFAEQGYITLLLCHACVKVRLDTLSMPGNIITVNDSGNKPHTSKQWCSDKRTTFVSKSA